MPLLKEIKQNIWLIALVFIYIVVNMILTWNEFYYLNFLPVLVFFVFIAFTRLDILFFIIVFLTPLSIQLIEFIHSSPVDFAIPTEPLLFGVMIIFLYKLVREGKIDHRIVNHPVSYAILFYLFWMFVTAITSSMPLVSFKFLLAKVWFIVTFYLLAIFIFKKTENIPLFIWCYALPMVFIVLYSIKRHMFYGLFDKHAFFWCCRNYFQTRKKFSFKKYLLDCFIYPISRLNTLLYKSSLDQCFILFWHHDCHTAED